MVAFAWPGLERQLQMAPPEKLATILSATNFLTYFVRPGAGNEEHQDFRQAIWAPQPACKVQGEAGMVVQIAMPCHPVQRKPRWPQNTLTKRD